MEKNKENIVIVFMVLSCLRKTRITIFDVNIFTQKRNILQTNENKQIYHIKHGACTYSENDICMYYL